MSDDLVYWSVMEANRRRGGQKEECPNCGERTVRVTNSVNPAYRSRYNPGECVLFECESCSYWEEIPC